MTNYYINININLLLLIINITIMQLILYYYHINTMIIHSLVCKQAPSRGARHHVLNDVVARASASVGFQFLREPAGLSRVDGKRPDAGKPRHRHESQAPQQKLQPRAKRPSIPTYRHSTPFSSPNIH